MSDRAAVIAGSPRLAALAGRLRELGSVVVAFSGGVDSGLLAAVAAAALGDRALAVTAVSETFSSTDREAAAATARAAGLRHRFIETRELAGEEFTANSPRRCYFCKRELFSKLRELAAAEGLAHVVDGATADDLDDYRPGRQAARELEIVSPLLEVGLDKTAVRQLAQLLGLPNSRRHANACLASRIAYGERITIASLARVEAAERLLQQLGFALCRVRSHGQLARIEVPAEAIDAAVARRGLIEKSLRRLGFTWVTLDLTGFRSGSMNEALGREVRAAAAPRPGSGE